MDQHQQLIGCQTHFLQLDSNDYPYGEPSRIQYLWQQNTKWGVNLLIDGAWQQNLVRENDKFIMDKVINKIKSPVKLKQINDVRLYLKLSRSSDIATVEGNHFHKWAVRTPCAFSIEMGEEMDTPSV